MAEGRYQGSRCISRCAGAMCGYVPAPQLFFSRRDPLIDAVGRTDNPCDRPARCPPCCRPVPKFRLPKEHPVCDINNFREEQRASKIADYWEQVRKYQDAYCPKCPPPIVIESLDPCNAPIGVEMPVERSPEATWFLKDQPCLTNIIAGFFNPDDNVPVEELRRRRCDPFYKACGGGGTGGGQNCMAPYPCRGVISSPKQAWVSLAQEQRLIPDESCEGSPYLEPEYLEAQQQLRDEMAAERKAQLAKERWEMLVRSGYKPPEPCCTERFSQSPYCLCNDNFC